jgi:hypothetical protein
MDSTQTLKSLLNADFTQLSASSMRDFESTDNIQQLRRSLQENVPDHQWDIIRQHVLVQAEQLLDMPLHPILIKSWHAHNAVKREIKRQQANNANHEESIVVLDSHEIRSTHSPTLITTVGKNNTIPLRFFIGIVLHLKHVSIKIQQGEITTILAGVMSGNGFMQHQNITLIEADFLQIKLAGQVSYRTNTSNTRHTIQDTVNAPIATPIAGLTAERKPDTSPPISTITNDNNSIDDNAIEITTENRYEKKPASAFKRNITQFILGLLLALVALFIFWQVLQGI